jgi:hypothetical protein
MKNFKYVKFSRRTAKLNSGMVIREYNRIITNQKNLVKEWTKLQYAVEVNIHDFDSNTIYKISNEIEKHGKHNTYSTSSVLCKLSFDYEKLKQIIKTIESKSKVMLHHIEILNEMKEELSRFKDKFGLW